MRPSWQGDTWARGLDGPAAGAADFRVVCQRGASTAPPSKRKREAGERDRLWRSGYLPATRVELVDDHLDAAVARARASIRRGAIAARRYASRRWWARRRWPRRVMPTRYVSGGALLYGTLDANGDAYTVAPLDGAPARGTTIRAGYRHAIVRR